MIQQGLPQLRQRGEERGGRTSARRATGSSCFGEKKKGDGRWLPHHRNQHQLTVKWRRAGAADPSICSPIKISLVSLNEASLPTKFILLNAISPSLHGAYLRCGRADWPGPMSNDRDMRAGRVPFGVLKPRMDATLALTPYRRNWADYRQASNYSPQKTSQRLRFSAAPSAQSPDPLSVVEN